MKRPDLAAIKARVGAFKSHDYSFRNINDMEFIANARTDIPALLEYIKELEDRIKELDNSLDQQMDKRWKGW